MKNLKEYENLGKQFFVATSKEHRFGTDAFLISNFAKILRKDIVADFGTGCGILSVLIYKKYTPRKIYAFDILESAVKLAKKSVLKSNLSEKIVVLQKNIKNLDKSFYDKFNKIVCNPPYKSLGAGKLSKTKINKIIRHETTLTIADVCKAANNLLKFHGSLFLSCRTERLCEVFKTMKENYLEPKKLQFCAKDKFHKPWIFIVEAKKGAKPFLNVLPNCFLE